MVACWSPCTASRAPLTRSRSCTRMAAETRRLARGPGASKHTDCVAFRTALASDRSVLWSQRPQSLPLQRTVRLDARPQRLKIYGLHGKAPLLQLQPSRPCATILRRVRFSLQWQRALSQAGLPPSRPPGRSRCVADGPGREFTFLVGQQSKRLVPAFFTSFLFDAGIVLLLVLLNRYGVALTSSAANLPEEPNEHIVWLNEPGPGGGGGGGGNKMKEPPKVAELPGKDKITVPVEKPPKLEVKLEAKNEPPPQVEQLNIPAKMLGASTESLPGIIENAPGPPTLSLGSGTGSGAGTGTGSGIGSGVGLRSRRRVRRWNRRRRLPAGQRRLAPAHHSRGEAAVHERRDAREDSGRRVAAVHGSAGRIGHRHSGGSLARSRRSVWIRKPSRPRVSGASRPARAWASRSSVQITIELTFTLR